MALYEALIVTGAWSGATWTNWPSAGWAPSCGSTPGSIRPLVLEWSTDTRDLWKRRTSIICQVGSKAETDVDLLARCIEPNLADRDFFIRKAIGWSLRQHAKIDPRWVQEFVSAHESRLSGLSRREAVKHLSPAPPARMSPSDGKSAEITGRSVPDIQLSGAGFNAAAPAQPPTGHGDHDQRTDQSAQDPAPIEDVRVTDAEQHREHQIAEQRPHQPETERRQPGLPPAHPLERVSRDQHPGNGPGDKPKQHSTDHGDHLLPFSRAPRSRS